MENKDGGEEERDRREVGMWSEGGQEGRENDGVRDMAEGVDERKRGRNVSKEGDN